MAAEPRRPGLDPDYFGPAPGEVVLPVPGAICDRLAPGDPSDRVALDAPLSVDPRIGPADWDCAPTPGLLASPPWVVLRSLCIVPGAICSFSAPGEPCECVALDAPPGVPGLVIAPDEPPVPVLPMGAAVLPLPGVWSGA